MPGLSCVCDLASPIDARLVARLSQSEENNGGDARSILWHDAHVVLLSSGYAEYPISVRETPDYLVCIEGRIYHVSDAAWYDSVPAIAADILSGESHALARAASHLAQIDGDFVVAFQDRRSRDVVIFNDLLGRLPLYVHRTNSSLILSRDVSLVLRAIGRPNFDRLGTAEYLLYGYPLGPRTLFSGVERVAAATAICVRRQARQITISEMNVPSVTPDPPLAKEMVRNRAQEVAFAFVQACAARVHKAEHAVLGLSGGLDSRSVAAALSGNHLPFLAVTRSGSPSDRETRIAAKVAAVLHLNWKAIPIPRPTGLDLLRLLQLKGGMNDLGMAFILPFFELLKADFGRGMILLTGDGGDKILPDLRPKSRIRNQQALVGYVLANHGIFPLAQVTALTGVSRHDIVAALEARISSYPEDSLEDRYVHFFLFERAFKYLFEGEDRNRHFFWSATPFYARETFFQAMRCHPQLKTNYAFYRFFMESLSPILVDVESTTCGRSLRLERYPGRLTRALRERIRELTPQSLRRRWRAAGRPVVAAGVLACIREQLSPSSPVTDFLSPYHVTAALEQLDLRQSSRLLTLTSAIEYFSTGRSTLERYRDVPF